MAIKIPLFKGKSLGFERDMVIFSVRGKRVPMAICKAIVDTGCPYTIISENSLKRVRVSLGSSKGSFCLGPFKLNLKELEDCFFSFRDEKDKPVTLKQEAYAGIPMTKYAMAREIPSMIGKDFIDNHSLSILNEKGNKYLAKE